MDATAIPVILGDDNSDRQYRSILHFDTSSLPDNAVIVSAIIKIELQSIVGANPFNTHQYIVVDIKSGYFYNNQNL